MNADEFKKKMDSALQARDRGAVDEGIHLLEELLSVGQHRPAVLGTLGLMLIYEKRDPARALPILREAVALSPKSERASLGLFHSLVQTGCTGEAFAEAKRFLAIQDSEEYSRLLDEIAAANPP